MTPEQIQELAKQIATNGLPPNWQEWGLLIALFVVVTALSAYLGAFWAKRAEIKAVKSKLQDVLDQTRRTTQVVEHEKSSAWVEQKRWDLKREIYTELIERLDRVTGIQSKAIHILRSNNAMPQDLKDQLSEATTSILPIIAFARIFLSKEALQAFREWIKGYAEARELSEQIGTSAEQVSYSARVPVIEAMRTSTTRIIDLLVESAKRDLILP